MSAEKKSTPKLESSRCLNSSSCSNISIRENQDNLEKSTLNNRSVSDTTLIFTSQPLPKNTPQLDLDKLYYIYIRNMIFFAELKKNHKQILRRYDDQLTQFEELRDLNISKNQNQKKNTIDAFNSLEILQKIVYLEKSINDICDIIESRNLEQKLEKINEHFVLFCNKFTIKNYINNEENYNKLQLLLEKMSKVLKATNEGIPEDYAQLIENIINIKNKTISLKQNLESVKSLQNIFNKFVLKMLSLNL